MVMLYYGYIAHGRDFRIEKSNLREEEGVGRGWSDIEKKGCWKMLLTNEKKNDTFADYVSRLIYVIKKWLLITEK